jgi:hypothetical protein
MKLDKGKRQRNIDWANTEDSYFGHYRREFSQTQCIENRIRLVTCKKGNVGIHLGPLEGLKSLDGD